MAFSLVVHGSVPKDEICGVIVGHIWYFFSDVYPSLHDGYRPFDPPGWWRRMFEDTTRGPEAQQDEHETDTANINHDMAAAAAPEVG